MKTYQLPAFLESYSSLKDRTIRLRFGTNELSPQQMADIHSSLNCTGFLAFNPEPFSTKQIYDIDALKVDFDAGKTPGQRLRGTLYRLFEKDNEGYKTFADYYNSKMEIIINHFKKKIDDL